MKPEMKNITSYSRRDGDWGGGGTPSQEDFFVRVKKRDELVSFLVNLKIFRL